MWNPKVSVIIPTYRRSDMLPRAIDSVFNQDYSNIQVVVVDDNDPNTEWRAKTQDRMRQYAADDRVKYICHSKNLNGSVARNTGIICSDGELVTFLDDDDVYRVNKVSEQVRYLLLHPEYRAVYCGWKRLKEIVPIGEGDLSFGILSGTQILITNVIMMWKNDAINCGGFDPILKRHQEAAFILNYFEHGGLIGRVGKVLVDFDVSDRSNVPTTKTNEKIINYLLCKHAHLLNKNEFLKKGSTSLIVSHRNLGLMYSFILEHKYIQALRKFFTSVIKSPFVFPKVLAEDVLYRLNRNSIRR